MQPWEESRLARVAGPAGLALGVLAGVVALSWIGHGDPQVAPAGVLTVLTLGPVAAGYAAVYLLAAFGLGRLPAWLLSRTSASRVWMQLGLGVGLMLFVSHVLGVAGLLSGEGPTPRLVGWGVAGLGLVLLADQVVRGELRPEGWPVLPVWAVLWAPALALLIVGATNPPGPLWSSEHGAYDALSYHLQLPKEWAAGDRLWPAAHNVYSYLPGYVESAFLHLSTLTGGEGDVRPERLLGGEGHWVLACQFLHTGLAVVTALLVARVAWMVLLGAGAEPGVARFAATAAGALVISVPWTIVVGSLAYNELATTAMFAAGLLAAFDAGTKPWARGVAAGFAAGVACSAKPTSLVLIAPAIGVVLLARTPARAWPRAVLGGSAAGVAAMAPWLIRNAVASGGNPVFPFAASLLGSGHWTGEQAARYARAHAFDGSVGERVARLFSSEFGLLHPQWSVAAQLSAVSLVVALLWRPTRRIALLLGAGAVVSLLAWMFLTHLQSRFLLPVVVPAALVFALAAGALLTWIGRGRGAADRGALVVVGSAVLAALPLCSAVWAVVGFLGENRGMPNVLLIVGPSFWTGGNLAGTLTQTGEEEREAVLSGAPPAAFVNLILQPQAPGGPGVYLLGDAAALFYVAAVGDAPAWSAGGVPRGRVVYHTTWDASPLGDAVRASAELPRAWTASLRERGLDFVLVNFAELERLIGRDHNYDPAVTLERVARWLSEGGEGGGPLQLEFAWPEHAGDPPGTSGLALFRLGPRTPAPTRSGSNGP